MTGLYVWEKHKNAEGWSGRWAGDPRTQGPRQGWLPGSPLSHKHTGCPGSQRPRNTDGNKQNCQRRWKGQRKHTTPRLQSNVTKKQKNKPPHTVQTPHGRQDSPHPSGSDWGSIRGSLVESQHCHPPPSQRMVPAVAWPGGGGSSCPHSVIACNPSPNDTAQEENLNVNPKPALTGVSPFSCLKRHQKWLAKI